MTQQVASTAGVLAQGNTHLLEGSERPAGALGGWYVSSLCRASPSSVTSVIQGSIATASAVSMPA